MNQAVYAVSADPVTFGHLDVIACAAKMFDKLFVAIGNNPSKKYLFNQDERVAMVRTSLPSHLLPIVTVLPFTGLLVDFAYERGITTIVRGIRDVNDFSYEFNLANANARQRPAIKTIFIPTTPALSHVSSSMAKAFQVEQGFVQEYVPLPVKQRLERRLSQQLFVGITGSIATGKSTLCSMLMDEMKGRRYATHNIDFDVIGHNLLDADDYLGEEVRKKIQDYIGMSVFDKVYKDGKYLGYRVNRKKLGEEVFGNPQKLKTLNEIMWEPLLFKVRKEIRDKRGIIFLNAALLVECGLLPLCNNLVIITHCKDEIQRKRLADRGLTEDQIRNRITSQYSSQNKYQLAKTMGADRWLGEDVWLYDSSEDNPVRMIAESISQIFVRLL